MPYDDLDDEPCGCLPLVLFVSLILIASLLTSCVTVPPDAYDQAEVSMFNKAFGTRVEAQPTKKLMFIP